MASVRMTYVPPEFAVFAGHEQSEKYVENGHLISPVDLKFAEVSGRWAGTSKTP